MDKAVRFREETYELLSVIESCLIELEKNPDNGDIIDKIFRAMHSLKGSGAMFGFDNISMFTHDIETIFDKLRCKTLSTNRKLIDLTLSACDQIRKMVNQEPENLSEIQEIRNIFRQMISECSDNISQNSPLSSGKPDNTFDSLTKLSTYRIHFHPSPNFLKNGSNPVRLLDELRNLGECRIVPQTNSVPLLKELDPETCYLNWDVILTTSEGIKGIREVFIFVEHLCELDIQLIDESDISEDESEYKRFGEILIDRGELSSEELERALKKQKKIGEILVEAKVIDEKTAASVLVEQQHVREKRKKNRESSITSSMRVSSEKLDRLVNMVGELVTFQMELRQKAMFQKDRGLFQMAEKLERMTDELRYNTMTIRMAAIGTIFNSFKRLVRDLSGELGKDIALITENEDTELDKTVIERLEDPLIHIIRNCIDHGIEIPEVRKASRKPRQGIIRLSAQHSGQNILIQISDDGAGLDVEKIRAKSIEKGFISAKEISETEIIRQIFRPGFSTAQAITELSGRGVGLDVVKRTIESLRGTVEISTQKGLGTIITLKLPLTLAIIDGILTQAGDKKIIFPLHEVEECLDIMREDLIRARTWNVVSFRENLIPYLNLRKFFNLEGHPPDIETVVISNASIGKFGFGVDNIIGHHQTVIKSLGKIYRQVEGISGVSILGDGTMAIILDINRITAICSRKTGQPQHSAPQMP